MIIFEWLMKAGINAYMRHNKNLASWTFTTKHANVTITRKEANKNELPEM